MDKTQIFLKGKEVATPYSLVKDKLVGAGAPGTATVGYVGQLYYNTTNNKIYICTAVSDTEPIIYTWSQIGAEFALITETGNKIDLDIDSSTYVMTATLKDKNNNVLSSDTLDLPLESMVVSGSYDSVNKKIVLTLQSGSTIDIPVADLVSGLQETFQYDTMPTADATTVGKVVQYIGVTDNTYTQGYFYIGITDGGDPATYSWGICYVEPHITGDYDLLITESNYNTTAVKNKLKELWARFNNDQPYKIYYKGRPKGSDYNRRTITCPMFFSFSSDFSTFVLSSPTFIEPSANNDGRHPIFTIVFWGFSNFSSINMQISDQWVSASSNGTLIAHNNTYSYTPTGAYNPATKKYVDDSITILSTNNIAPLYSASSIYPVGSYVMYNNQLYVCNTAITTAEEWTAAHWTATTVMEVVGNINVLMDTFVTVDEEEY